MFRSGIRYLRLRGGAAGDPRPWLNWLAQADIEPPALPAAAILLVRQLHARGGWAGRQPQVDWSQATQAVLQRLLLSAARPAGGHISPTSPAVLFADRAELLACLCRDWLAGRLGAWWWRCLFPGGIDPPRLAAILLQDSPQLPALLRRLHHSRLALPLLQALPVAATWQLWRVLQQDFALPALDLQTGLPPAADTHQPEPSLAFVDGPPWQLFLPPQAGLAPLAEMLLGVALQLASDAPTVRRPAYAVALQAWWRRAAADVSAVPPDADSQPLRDDAAVAKPLPPAPPKTSGPTPAIAGAAPMPAADEPEPAAVAPRACPTQPDPPATGLAGDPAAAPSAAPLPVPPPDLQRAAPLPPTDLLQAALLSPAVSRISSRFGGLFYLLNPALSLQLYGDFTRPRQPGIPLSPWDWLALAGERLLGPELRGDPLWNVLAQLACRAADCAPGEGCDAPAGWQLPDDWRDLLVDAPPARFDSLAHWLDWLLPLLLARLAFALDCPESQVATLLCCQRAQLEIGETRIDVHMQLDELQIEIRIAGLDRDPGWIPAAGREVRFHFHV